MSPVSRQKWSTLKVPLWDNKLPGLCHVPDTFLPLHWYRCIQDTLLQKEMRCCPFRLLCNSLQFFSIKWKTSTNSLGVSVPGISRAFGLVCQWTKQCVSRSSLRFFSIYFTYFILFQHSFFLSFWYYFFPAISFFFLIIISFFIVFLLCF